MKRITIQDIDFSLDYEGYYWYSNSSEPVVANNLTDAIFTRLPFIVEGNLYAREKGISISIRYIDGEYYIFQADLNYLPAEQCTEDEYIANNKLGGVKKIRMMQFWEETDADPLLEGMTTLVPTWVTFKGFIK